MDNEKNKTEKGALYLVATPIGNSADISERALKVLSECDFIAAEDTRNTGNLLRMYGIKKPLFSYHEHNKASAGAKITERLRAGETCALVTDAGTPAISDPGEDLVKLCVKEHIKIFSVPGACAAITALTLSGIDTRRFVFEGFLPTKNSERREKLDELSGETRTVIIYEAPHRIKDTLTELYEKLGDRSIALCRELTKLNEEVVRMPLSEAKDYFLDNQPRGEFVIVIAGAEKKKEINTELSAEEHVKLFEEQGYSRMDAIKAAAKERGMTKSELYAIINVK